MKNKRDLLAFGIVASAGPQADPSKLPEPNYSCFVSYRLPIPWRHSCGHWGNVCFQVSIKGAQGKKVWFNKLCPMCLMNDLVGDVISCALCGLPITPGKAVAAYASNNPEVMKEVAFYLDENTVLGCMRINCCPSGGFFAGHWMGKEEGFAPFELK